MNRTLIITSVVLGLAAVGASLKFCRKTKKEKVVTPTTPDSKESTTEESVVVKNEEVCHSEPTEKKDGFSEEKKVHETKPITQTELEIQALLVQYQDGEISFEQYQKRFEKLCTKLANEK